MDMLEKVYLSVNIDDKRLWSADSKGHFSDKSFYNVLSDEQATILGWRFYWHKLIPRVDVFCWLVRQ